MAAAPSACGGDFGRPAKRRRHCDGEAPEAPEQTPAAPAAVSLKTGKPVPVPAQWASARYAAAVAARHEGADAMRRLGTLAVDVEAKDAAASLNKLLTARPSHHLRIIANARGATPRRVETWHKETGEAASRDGKPAFSIHLLHAAAQDGRVVVSDAALVEGLAALMRPAVSPWKCPLVRVEPDGALPHAHSAQLRLTVYASRLLFELVADDAVRRVILALGDSDVASPITDPLLNAGEVTFTSGSEAQPEDGFASDDLLEAAVSTRAFDATVPAKLAVALLPFQRHALGWMQMQERLGGLGLNSLFWEKRRFPGTTDVFFFMPASGDVRLDPLPVVRGGMLCEEMGMGKTVEVLALIAADVEAGHCSKPTLVVCPPTLLFQWHAECSKVSPSLIAVVHHVDGANAAEHREAAADTHERLAKANIILTTYRTLEVEAKPQSRTKDIRLRSLSYRRVILDECQEVRSSTTQLARSCDALLSDFRWMVSGTPLHTGIDDLNGELAFLRVYPFCLHDSTDGFFGLRIKEPLAVKDPTARKLVVQLLSSVCCRHVKSQRNLADGAPILSLGSAGTVHRRVTYHQTDDASARYVATFLSTHAATEAALARDAAATARGTGAATAANRRAASLLRLVRQATTAPSLVPLRDAEAVLRRVLNSHVGAGGISREGGSKIASMDARQAMIHLLQPRARTASPDFVSFQTSASAWRGAARTYAHKPVEERLEDAMGKALTSMASAGVCSGIESMRRTLEAVAQDRERMAQATNRDEAALSARNRAKRLLEAAMSLPKLAEAAQHRAEKAVMEARQHVEAEAAKRMGKGKAPAAAGYDAAPLSAAEKAANSAETRAEALRTTLAAKLGYCDLLSDVLAGLGSADGAELDLESSKVTQEGFQMLHKLAQGEEDADMQCSICLRQMTDPCFTPCIHGACASCLLRWFEAEGGIGKARCVLCRQPVSLRDVVKVIPSAPLDLAAMEEANAAAKESDAAAASAVGEDAEWRGVRPSLVPEPLDARFAPAVYQSSGFPALSNDGGVFLAHHAAALSRGVLHGVPKLRVLLELVQAGGTSKAVVFSQEKAHLQLAHEALALGGVSGALVLAGMQAKERQASVSSFVSGDVQVLLLHAGVAAAGLTLTVARRCYFLEPFAIAADEEQALGRVHRIGQTGAVSATVLYVPGSFEERLLALRADRERAELFAGLPMAARVARLLAVCTNNQARVSNANDVATV